MKRIIAILLLPALALTVPARATAQSSGDSDIIARVAARSASIQSFEGKFKQTQKVPLLNEPVVSYGKMQYRKDGSVLWKYTSPDEYQIAFTADEIRIHNASGDSVTSLAGNPLVANLKGMLMGIMDGSTLASPQGFSTSVTQSGGAISLVLLPSSRSTSKLFKSLTLTFSSADMAIEGVKMEEPDGSTTEITFYDRIIK